MDVKTAWLSKINWGEAIKALAMILTLFGVNLPPEIQADLLGVIIAVGAIYTWVMRTWFTTKLTSASAAKVSDAAKVASMLVLGVLAAGLALPTRSLAAPPKLHATGNIVKDIQDDIKDAGTSSSSSVVGSAALTSALAKPFQDLADFLASDATEAATLAVQIPELQDGHGQQCWLAMSTAGKVFQAHPVPVTFKAMTDVEALRLLAMTANNLCSNVHCTQVFADLTSMAQAASPAPLPIPGLHDLCSKIPQIAQSAPAASPALAAPTAPAVAPAK